MVALITNQQLVEGSPLGGNIDAEKYKSVILEAQVFVIEPVLGTKLFNKILQDFEGGSITGIYQTILEMYVQPILIKTVAAEYIILSGIAVDNAGVVQYTPQNAQPASRAEREHQANNQRAKADVYLQRLNKFLCDKRSEIPEYTSAQDNNSDIKPHRSVKTFAGWYLRGRMPGTTNAHIEMMRDIINDG